MITPIHPQAPQFAGRNKKTTTLKAGLVGLLLGTAGTTALPTGGNGLTLKGQQNNALADSFTYTPEPPKESLFDKLTGHHSEETAAQKLETRQQLENYTSFDDEPPIYLTDDTRDTASRMFLKKRPFAPKDVNLFGITNYPAGKPMAPAPDSETSEQEIKDTLLKVLTNRFKGDADKAKKAAAVFDSNELKQIIPNARLRAALVNLRGTTGRSAIDVYTGNTYSSVDFSNEIGNATIARVLTEPGKMPKVAFNARYKGEDFQLLSPTMAHEALHQDAPVSATEELIADAMDVTVYAQQLLENPELSKQDTELARRYNSKLLGRLNSRDDEGNVRIFSSKGNVFPGGKTVIENFGKFQNMNNTNEAVTTAGNQHLKGMLKAVTGQEIQSPAFNKQTLTLLDENLKSLKPEQVVKLAEILKLDVGNEPSCGNQEARCGQNNNNEQTSGATTNHKIPKALLLSLGLGLPTAKAMGII